MKIFRPKRALLENCYWMEETAMGCFHLSGSAHPRRL